MKVNKIGFFHDHRFMCLNGNTYSSGGLPSEVWERYLNHCDRLIVVGREIEPSNNHMASGFSISSRPSVSFNLTLDLTNIRIALFERYKVKKDVRNVVADIDFAVIRLPSIIGMIAIREMKRAGKPYIVEVVDCAFDGHWYHHSIFRKAYAPFAYLFLRYAISTSPAVIYVTKNFLQKRYPSKSVFSTNISNVDLSTASKLKNYPKTNEGLSVIKIGMLGNLNNRLKGFEFGIRLLNELNSVSDNYKFVLSIAGGGDKLRYKNICKELNNCEDVIFEGALESGQNVFSWLDSLSFYLHPSKKEGLPRSLIEAMSRGLVCLGTPIAGIPELLADEDLIKYGDFENCTSKIFSYLSNPKAYSLKGELNREVSKIYTPEVLKSRRIDFIDSFIKSTFN